MSSTRGTRQMLERRASRSDDPEPARPTRPGCFCCFSNEVVESVVEFANAQAGSLRAAPPLMLSPGYANEEGTTSGRAPPTRGVFEVVNKSKYSNEIIGVLVSPIAAELALKRQRDVLGHLEYLRHGCMPAQTVMHGTFGDDLEVLEVALFYGCKQPSVDALTTVPSVADAFEHVKGYRVACKGRNVVRRAPRLLRTRDPLPAVSSRAQPPQPPSACVARAHRRRHGRCAPRRSCSSTRTASAWSRSAASRASRS
jgi:hypothetical protein